MTRPLCVCVQAYQRDEIKNFEQILKQNQQKIMEDTFIRNYIQDLLKNIRTQVLVKTIKPYTRIKIPSIAAELNIPEADVEALLVSLILDRKIQGLHARLYRFAPHLLDEGELLYSHLSFLDTPLTSRQSAVKTAVKRV